MPAVEKYWFPAKTYGWGWGAPVRWQGWAALAIYLGLLMIDGFIFPFARMPYAYVAFVAVIGFAFLVTCWLTGDPSGRRWHKK